jgi:hypothetical protein
MYQNDITEALHNIDGITVSYNSTLKLQYVEVDGNKLLAFRHDKQNNLITVFPFYNYFSSTKLIELTPDQFINLVESKRKEVIN